MTVAFPNRVWEPCKGGGWSSREPTSDDTIRRMLLRELLHRDTSEDRRAEIRKELEAA